MFPSPKWEALSRSRHAGQVEQGTAGWERESSPPSAADHSPVPPRGPLLPRIPQGYRRAAARGTEPRAPRWAGGPGPPEPAPPPAGAASLCASSGPVRPAAPRRACPGFARLPARPPGGGSSSASRSGRGAGPAPTPRHFRCSPAGEPGASTVSPPRGCSPTPPFPGSSSQVLHLASRLGEHDLALYASILQFSIYLQGILALRGARGPVSCPLPPAGRNGASRFSASPLPPQLC